METPEVFLKTETVDLHSGHESVFVISVLGPDGQERQLIMEPNAEPEPKTLKYLGMTMKEFEAIMEKHGEKRHIAMQKFVKLIQSYGDQKPIPYVWNNFTSNRLVQLVKRYNLGWYTIFKTTPICVSELHKFIHRDESGTVPARMEDAARMYNLKNVRYLEGLKEMVNHAKRHME